MGEGEMSKTLLVIVIFAELFYLTLFKAGWVCNFSGRVRCKDYTNDPKC